MNGRNGTTQAIWPACTGLVIATYLIIRESPTTFAADKPVHTAIATFAICGATVLIASRSLPRKAVVSSKSGYDLVPLNEEGHANAARDASPLPVHQRYDDDGDEELDQPSPRQWRSLFLALVFSLCLRAEVWHRVVKNVQCSGRTCTPIIPVLLAAWEFWRGHSARKARQRKATRVSSDDDVDASVYDVLLRLVAQSAVSGVATASMVGFGGLLALNSLASPHGTYICAGNSSAGQLLPFSGTVSDAMIAMIVGRVVTSGGRSLASRCALLGWAFMFSATFLFGIGAVYYLAEEADRTWILTIPRYYVWHVLRLDVYIAFALLSAFAMTLHAGLVTTSLIVAFTSIVTAATPSAWTNQHPFPPYSLGLAYLGIAIAILGLLAYLQLETISSASSPRRRSLFSSHLPAWLYILLLAIFLTWTGLKINHSTSVSYHPIDLLIYEAEMAHDKYATQAGASKDLKRATQIYRNRYGRHPPPGFDLWFKYATDRKSVIIDDFNSINRDLLPFYALTPQEIRHRTWEMVANQWNFAAGISIRSGKVSVMPNIAPTHGWMGEGVAEMISKFSEYLPDMDLAFNLNDESRIAVPHDEIERMRQVGRGVVPAEKPIKTFSADRAATWEAIEPPLTTSPLEEFSWQQTFHRYGAVGCPPSSPAVRSRVYDTSSLCTSCAAPHSLGAFLSNWTLSSNICHQPDLANLHGFYLSPASFKSSHELYPIFSQSKVGGFNDILYPSAWNYLDKALYFPTAEHPDRPWEEKSNTLFWRGATSEGVSQGWGQWQGMTRQRFVYLANHPGTLHPILLPNHPSTPDEKKMSYRHLPLFSLSTSIDVKHTHPIVRCGGVDCDAQAIHLAPLAETTVDFQAHWQHKYLLDLDGAGFSGRFLPFLRSGSLVLKAGLFREWWEDRVRAWKHFVPLDVRGHGLAGTVAYLGGVGDGNDVQGMKWEAKDAEAKRIAEQGKEWAEKVMRKEDMEIYLFRLLLEWGRLTDDRRDELGFEV
ncbi:unnamed protein product [Zymoseptoria tritici ST99CH_1A5]|uniref:Glycosyl transferase CAP10 domain-containing protein n=2 Tax=Zymoseptoria tritici TaxID=1047171 RepID=A0A2H1GHF0_ZYMTR|nr:unnamed protein product [Zymoseptoria tritici ST99CH_1E4]SMR54437.1 unnamed protein product [Zymoseptoria tritici ST99CH_3D1]SMY24704.1 unnamed protein product [Zymoseptoria tritici ST99CH_1A5]